MKNLVFNLRTAKAQAEGCAKVTKSSRMAKILTTLTLLLSLCVGQMWADVAGFWSDGAAQVTFTVNGRTVSADMNSSGFSEYDLGTVESLTLKSAWAKTWKNGGNVCGVDMYYKVSTTKPNTTSMTKKELRTFEDLGSGNQKISKSDINTSLTGGLTAGTTYYITINFDLYGNKNSGSGCYTGNGSLNNGNNQYIFKFKMADSKTKFTQGKYLYFDGRNQTSWDDANYSAIFYFKRYDTEANISSVKCASTSKLENWVYYAVVPSGSYNGKVQVNRVKPSDDTFWNKTNIMAASGRSTASQNCLVGSSSSWDNWSPTWGTYAPPLSSVSLSDNGTAILAGEGTELNPYLIATGATIKVVASGTKAVADPDATIWYDIKDNTTSKQNSSTAACSFTASATANTVYQMKVDGYTKVSSTSSTKLTSDIIYYKTVSVKNITVYIFVGGCTTDQINSLVLTGTPYVGSVALSGVTKYIGDFTTDGNWRKYTFTNVSEVRDLVVARSGGRAVDNITATADVYAKWDGTTLDGKCFPLTTPTWNTAPANGAVGGSMTATISNVPAGATVTWSSTASSYASVNSSGVISYVATGSATIKARIQKAASGDNCAMDETLSQAITVTSGATVTATRTCPAYVSTGAGEVTLDITSTGASSGWYYRIKNKSTGGYYAPDNQSAASNALSWTMTGGIGTGLTTLVVELYNGSNTLICTSSDVTVTGEIAHITYIAAGSNGSVSPTTIYANNNHVHPSITATPNSHYHFKNWTSNNAAASVASTTNATTTVTATAGGYMITANFEGDQYTITYKDKDNAAYSGSNQASLPATHRYGTATDLVNGVRSGYTFVGWYTDASCTISAGSSIGATAKTSNFTLYAKWTAKTYDITYVDANNVATIADNPSTGSTDATINFTVTMKPGFKSLSVTAVDAGSNTVTVTNPSSNNYRFTMPASAVTVTVSATALPIVYVLKTKHASSSLGDGATGLPATGQIWAWKASGSNNFYTTPGSFPGPSASSKATVITDDIIGDEWYRFIPDNVSPFDGSTAYHVILTSTGRILDTQSTFIENGSSHSAATHTGTIWIVPHGTDANTAYLYTSYPDEIATPYNTTYYAGDHGSINVFGTTISSGNSQTIATTKNRTLTATPASGYEFNRWITTGSVTVADATSATTTVSATGAGGTVTATYFETVNSGWYITGHPAGDKWVNPTTHPLNRVLPGETNVYYRPVTLPATDQYFRFWCSTGGNHDYGASSNNLPVTKGTKYNLAYDRGDNFKYSAGGTVWFVVDASGATKKFWLQDPVEFYSVNFGYGDGCDEFTAKDGEDHDLVSGNTYIAGTALTFTQTEKAGYTFVEWNTAANGSGSKLGDDDTYSVASLSADVNVYAIYTENKTAITITTDGHGTITTPSPNSSPYSLGVTTGQAINASASTGYHWNTWTVSGTAALGTTATTASNTAKGNGTEGGTGTVTATFTPNTYRVQFHRNGGAGVVVYQDFTYDVAQNLTANSYTRTGYNFAGWALTTDGAVTYANGAEVSNLTTTNEGTFHLYAKWTPKQSALTFDYQTSVEGYGADGTLSSVYATYGAAMPALSGNMPTAANGYAFMGFYSETGGNGTKYYNADKSSAHNWDVDTESGTTLYAYYKKAEITELALDAAVVQPNATVGVTPTIEPTPTPSTIICWKVLHGNGNPLDAQPTFTWDGTKLTFAASPTSGTYLIQAVLRTGSVCGSGTVLDSVTAPFQVAGDHVVTVQYKCGDEFIKASTTATGLPLDWTEITAPNIVGYSFSKWKAGDGITIEGADGNGEKASATINFKAIYEGKLTAIYTAKRMIYFNNTLGWSGVTVYFYKNASYWNNTNGTGASTTATYTNTPYSDGKHGEMTQIEGTNIWYYDLDANSVDASLTTVNFTEINQHGYNFFAKTGDVKNKVAHPCDGAAEFNSGLRMYVPINADAQDMNGGLATYYFKGYWMHYPNYSGYTLKIYSSESRGAGGTTYNNDEIKSFDIPHSADFTMPISIDVDLEANKKYYFDVYRNDYTYFGNNGDMKSGNSSGWSFFNTDTRRAGLQTTAAGSYKFNWSFYNGSDGYNYYMTVTYPVATNDYRIYYTDNATWSHGAHTLNVWSHPSGVITKNTDASATKYDTVSFFISKDNSPAMKFQYASAINASTGAVTWSNVASGSITIPSAVVTESGVYNFIVKQVGIANPVIEKVEKYDGEYYIRTDCANSKWDNYDTDPDHRMTYSEYSITHGGYSHYYCHWVKHTDTGRKNVKFVIANDYSHCISDTLTQEDSTDPAWTSIGSFITAGGDLLRDANVRFMWNQSTNKISRAYVDGAQGDDSNNFLKMLSADGKITDLSGETLTEVKFQDNENWIYEANIQAQPNAEFKLISNWGTGPVITQYFKGTSSSYETLITGSGTSFYTIRVLYDFKTNRLIAALLPSGDIDNPMPINADVMFIREHQGDINQVILTDDGTITNIKTAYGVVRFNKWTINNKSKEGGHDPLTTPASIYERSLYWVSFPFRVKLSEVFGFGTYGTHWIIQYYDGAARAEKGMWAETGTYWKFVWDRRDFFLEPNTGYLLTVETDLMGEESGIWGPESRSEQVELFFPSYGTMPNITQADVTMNLEAHTCTIDRTGEGLPGGNDYRTTYDRRIVDSHWNVMGVPTYINTDDVTFPSNTWTTTSRPNFLYTWNMDDNTITATSASKFTFHAMHAYMVQCYGDVTWSAHSGSPYPIVARSTYSEAPKAVEFCLELQQNEKMIDRTFIKLSDDEDVSEGFAFNEDMTKEFSGNKSAIYTFIAGDVVAAGNTLPMTDQKTIVPVGVETKAAGTYTISIPAGTAGIGVTLIDEETGIRTNLSALDYTVDLSAGKHDSRFWIEISPVKGAETGIDPGVDARENGVRKVMIDGLLYIVKDGKLFDATGKRVE